MKRRVSDVARVGAVVWMLLGMLTVGTAAQTTYVQEMPSADQVTAAIAGDDVMDWRARQIAALSRRYDLLREMAGNRYSTGPFPNAAEKAIVDDYRATMTRLTNEGLATFGGVTGVDSPRAAMDGIHPELSDQPGTVRRPDEALLLAGHACAASGCAGPAGVRPGPPQWRASCDLHV
jgi:hypothetical protein